MKFVFRNLENEVEEEKVQDNFHIFSEQLNWNPTTLTVGSPKKKRDDAELEQLWNLFLTDETANSIVVAISTIMLGEHFEITGVEKDTPEYTFWKDVFIRNWNTIWEICCDTLVFGNSFSLKVNTRSGKFHSFKILYPLAVKKEEIDNKIVYHYNDNLYTPDEMFESYFFPRSDSIYALSLLAPIKSALNRKRTSEASIDTALTRHFPRFHITVKPDPSTRRYANYEERRKIANKFKSLATDQEFVSTDLIDIKTLDTKGGIPDIEAYINYFSNAVYIGARIPPEVIGSMSRTTTYATAVARVTTFLNYVIPFYQRNLEYHIKNQIMLGTDAMIDIRPPSNVAIPESFSKNES